MGGAGRLKILVWQWGRFGAGPRFATYLAEGLASVPGVAVSLSLATGAEISRGASPPPCDLPMTTYEGLAGFLARIVCAPVLVHRLARRIAALRPDIAVCALPGPLDLLMAAALRRHRIPFVVIVHDSDGHPGDGFPCQMWLQRMLCRQAVTVAALTAHVGQRLLNQKLAGTPGRTLIRLRHPPMRFEFSPRRRDETGTFRLLYFGRLLRYKGLDLLAESLTLLGSPPGLAVRVVGSGPESAALAVLRGLPGVTVENRWVPETEVGALFSWADAVVLPYREASQSGVAAVALAAGRYVIATNVGGLAEQLSGESLAIMCDPEASSLAAGLRRLLAEPPGQVGVASPDTSGVWRDVGQSLVDQINGLRRDGVERREARQPAG